LSRRFRCSLQPFWSLILRTPTKWYRGNRRLDFLF